MGKSTAYEFFMPKVTLGHMNKSTAHEFPVASLVVYMLMVQAICVLRVICLVGSQVHMVMIQSACGFIRCCLASCKPSAFI